VNVDFVAEAISTLHQKEHPQYDTYHLSSGDGIADISGVDAGVGGGAEQTRAGISAVGGAAVCRVGEFSGEPQGSDWAKGASLMKVFMPYLVWNTVFDNTRVTSELGKKPVPFSEYSYPLLKFSSENNFEYKYQAVAAAQEGQPHDGLYSGGVGQQQRLSAPRLDGCWVRANAGSRAKN
jgi:hypothetical protein